MKPFSASHVPSCVRTCGRQNILQHPPPPAHAKARTRTVVMLGRRRGIRHIVGGIVCAVALMWFAWIFCVVMAALFHQ